MCGGCEWRLRRKWVLSGGIALLLGDSGSCVRVSEVCQNGMLVPGVYWHRRKAKWEVRRWCVRWEVGGGGERLREREMWGGFEWKVSEDEWE